MKYGQSSKKDLVSSEELKNNYNRLSKTLNRLMILDYVWKQQVGAKARFWVLKAVQKDTLFVQVRASVAKNELQARQSQLIRELNKAFDTPWIKRIKTI